MSLVDPNRQVDLIGKQSQIEYLTKRTIRYKFNRTKILQQTKSVFCSATKRKCRISSPALTR